ncbi:site-specific integrase [Rhodoblastus sp.]|jgi:integrase|uniref:tyrosine-type recombinase/integrase n=1 Tax=Rhodoblastus sp. TaxID=1962975 RepID=UPI0025CDABBB|nr:site-specific integrase [Rhodoblastus sp.]
MAIKFTDTSVNGLKPEPSRKDYLVFDTETPSLGVRVSSSGRKTFLFQSRTKDGRSFRKALGRFGNLTVMQARNLAKLESAAMVTTLDPFAKREEDKAILRQRREADAFTLAVLLGDWEKAMAPKCRPNSLKVTLSSLTRGFAGLLAKPVAAIQVKDVSKALDLVRANSGPIAMHAAAVRIKAVFRWAYSEGHIDVNQLDDRLKLPPAGAARDRSLTEEELHRVWAAAGTLSPLRAAYVRFLMLTLVRRTEALGLRWAEITGDVWHIPGARMKQAKPHRVDLAPPAKDVLATLPRHDTSDIVFTTDGLRVMGGMQRIKVALDEALVRDGGPVMKPWTYHDFRRSGVTWLAKKGVGVDVADKLLAHKSSSLSSVALIYQQHDFAEKRAEALRMWGQFLAEGKVDTANVIPMKKQG